MVPGQLEKMNRSKSPCGCPNPNTRPSCYWCIGSRRHFFFFVPIFFFFFASRVVRCMLFETIARVKHGKELKKKTNQETGFCLSEAVPSSWVLVCALMSSDLAWTKWKKSWSLLKLFVPPELFTTQGWRKPTSKSRRTHRVGIGDFWASGLSNCALSQLRWLGLSRSSPCDWLGLGSLSKRVWSCS